MVPGAPTPLPDRLAGLPAHRLGGRLVVVEAATLRARTLGLALLDDLHPDVALLIPRCRSVHTLGMRFAVDVAFLDAAGKAARLVRALPARRIAGALRASTVLEARSGALERFLAAGAGTLAAELSRRPPAAAAGS